MQPAKPRCAWVAAAAIVALVAGCEPKTPKTQSPVAPAAAAPLTGAPARMQALPDFSALVDEIGPAIVNIRAITDSSANVQDGARIEIPAGAIVDGFIHLLFIGSGEGIWSHPRNVIVAGANSQVAVVETYVGTGSYFTNAVTEIVAHAGAVVDHARLECESHTAYHVSNVFIRQERSANVTSRTIALGAAIARSETHVVLAGEGASIVLDGLFVGTGTQHLDNRTVIDHVQPHCESLELYKGVLDQSARGVFDGLIIVRPGAEKTVSRQTNRNLLLSESAIVDSKPNLEIHNNDVKCNHGSTIGQIDEQALFYLRSRGIGEDEARGLLVYAFAGEIVDRIRIEPVREQVRRAMFQSMPERLPERRGGIR